MIIRRGYILFILDTNMDKDYPMMIEIIQRTLRLFNPDRDFSKWIIITNVGEDCSFWINITKFE